MNKKMKKKIPNGLYCIVLVFSFLSDVLLSRQFDQNTILNLKIILTRDIYLSDMSRQIKFNLLVKLI